MENETNDHKLEPTQTVQTTKRRQRKKKTVSDIELQIQELQKKKEEMILKTKADIGNNVVSILYKNDITLESIEENSDLFFEKLQNVIESNIQNFKEILD